MDRTDPLQLEFQFPLRSYNGAHWGPSPIKDYLNYVLLVREDHFRELALEQGVEIVSMEPQKINYTLKE